MNSKSIYLTSGLSWQALHSAFREVSFLYFFNGNLNCVFNNDCNLDCDHILMLKDKMPAIMKFLKADALSGKHILYSCSIRLKLIQFVTEQMSARF